MKIALFRVILLDNFYQMSRNFISKTRKKKVVVTSEIESPEEIAQLHLMQVSEQANIKQQNGPKQMSQFFLKLFHHETNTKPKKAFIAPYKQPKLEKTQQNDPKSHRSPYKDQTRTTSINNRIIGSQVFVGAKNSLALTNYLIMDDDNKNRKNINLSFSLPITNSTYVKKMKRRKSLNNTFQISYRLQKQFESKTDTWSSRIKIGKNGANT